IDHDEAEQDGSDVYGSAQDAEHGILAMKDRGLAPKLGWPLRKARRRLHDVSEGETEAQRHDRKGGQRPCEICTGQFHRVLPSVVGRQCSPGAPSASGLPAPTGYWWAEPLARLSIAPDG